MTDVRPELHAELEAIVTDCSHAFPQVQASNEVAVQAILADLRTHLDKADALAAELQPPPPVNVPPVWTDFTPPPAKAGQTDYSYQFRADGATHYGIIGSQTPVLGFDQYTGLMSGTPLWAGTYSWHMWAENAYGRTYQFSITMQVTP